MVHFLLVCYLLTFAKAVVGVHIFKLGYRVTPEPTLTSPDYDCIVFVSSQPVNDSTIPTPIREALSQVAKVGGGLGSEITVVEVGLPAKRIIYARTGPLSDFPDVRRFGEAAKKAIARVVEAKYQSPLLVLHPDPRPKFPHAELVTLLGALEALYVNIQKREKCPHKCSKVKCLGVWGPEYSTLIDIVNIAANLEDGRIVARDIAEADSERMSPMRVEEYIREVFPPESAVNISVVSNPQELQREFPLFSMVNKAASGVEKHAGRIIFLSYQTNAPVVDTVLLVGNGVTYNTGGSNTMSRDRAGAAAVAGFMKVLSDTRVGGLKVLAALALTQISRGDETSLANEVIRARSGKRVSVANTDAEGRMVLADVLCYMKEHVEKKEAAINPYIISISAGHAKTSDSSEFSIVMDNGPAAKAEEGETLKINGDKIGEPLEASALRKEDFDHFKEGDGLMQSKDIHTTRGPAAFLIMASGLDKHSADSQLPIKYSHLNIAGDQSSSTSASSVLPLANRFILRLEDPVEPGYH